MAILVCCVFEYKNTQSIQLISVATRPNPNPKKVTKSYILKTSKFYCHLITRKKSLLLQVFNHLDKPIQKVKQGQCFCFLHIATYDDAFDTKFLACLAAFPRILQLDSFPVQQAFYAVKCNRYDTEISVKEFCLPHYSLDFIQDGN